jgi:hypothetical protein
MSDVIMVAILVAAFMLAIALVRVLGRMIDGDADLDIAEDDDLEGFSRPGGPRGPPPRPR